MEMVLGRVWLTFGARKRERFYNLVVGGGIFRGEVKLKEEPSEGEGYGVGESALWSLIGRGERVL